MRRVLTASVVLLFATAASAVTVVNGSFETGPSGPVLFASDEISAASLASPLTGWTVFRGGVTYVGNRWQASDGVQSISLSSGGAGGITQRIAGFAPGQRYRMSFDVAADPSSRQAMTRVYYSASGGDAAMFDYLASNNSALDMRYSHVTYDFVAGGRTQQIMFFGTSNEFGPVIDNVAISAIPEPATWGLLTAGFAGIGALVRRRARLRATLA